MGCCFSSDEDKYLDANDSERAPLLDPAHNDIQHNHGTGPTSYVEPNNREDEQSDYSRILRQTASNFIDVTSTDVQNIQQGEIQDRATQYSNRLNMELSKLGKTRVYKPKLPNTMISPQLTLSSAPVLPSDVQLIMKYSEKLANAAGEIKIQHKENLVVTFAVP